MQLTNFIIFIITNFVSYVYSVISFILFAINGKAMKMISKNTILKCVSKSTKSPRMCHLSFLTLPMKMRLRSPKCSGKIKSPISNKFWALLDDQFKRKSCTFFRRWPFFFQSRLFLWRCTF